MLLQLLRRSHLLLGVIGMTSRHALGACRRSRWLVDARRAEREAKQEAVDSAAQYKTERDAKEQARKEAEQISKFLVDVFPEPRPDS